MKSFSRAIDRFCFRHPRFGIPKLILYIVIPSAFVCIFMNTPGGIEFLRFDPALMMRGQIWRLITWIFLPINVTGGIDIFFTIIALFFYYFIGSTLEREWGTGRFTVYYLLGMLMHIIYGFIIHIVFKRPTPLSSVHLNLSMFFAFAVLFPDITIRLFLIIPIKIKWAALIAAAFFVYSLLSDLIRGRFIDALLPLVALSNFILICGDELRSYLRPILQSVKRRASPNVINFKKEARRAKRSLDDKPYRHKCAVCAMTDTGNPEMEFRYCSMCNGYHCFCSEHINNHVHFR